MDPSPTDQLATALEATGRLIAAIEADQWELPTPCVEWTVGDVVAHLAAGNNLFETALRHQQPDSAGLQGGPGCDLPTAYQRSVDGLLDTFRQPGAMENVVEVPFGTVPGVVAAHLRIIEALVHGWDVAHATGQQATFPDDLVEPELAFTQATLGSVPPGQSPFAPPQPVADDAPAIERLAGLLGRAVTAEAPAP